MQLTPDTQSSLPRLYSVSILYAYNENWIGSTYYIQSMISAMNHLDEQEKPAVQIVTRFYADFEKLKSITGYPYLSFRKLSLFERVMNNLVPAVLVPGIIRKLCWGNAYSGQRLLFPATHGVSFSVCPNRLFWVPDFQEHFYPDFFSPEEIKKRKLFQQQIIRNGKHIVFSSESARDNFNDLYPDNKVAQHVMPFIARHPDLSHKDFNTVALKYEIQGSYFICSNQFWKHKNHIVVLRALAELRAKGVTVQVVFTGKVHDYRNPDYFNEITKLIEELGIGSQVKFLGFISREDQLLLMKHAAAVIQPSLFEGWSTVVEDAKALGIRILVSSLDVHKEQLRTYSGKFFFDPIKPEELVQAIQLLNTLPEKIVYDYAADERAYTRNIYKIIKDISEQPLMGNPDHVK